jgi:hypothetical protein
MLENLLPGFIMIFRVEVVKLSRKRLLLADMRLFEDNLPKNLIRYKSEK